MTNENLADSELPNEDGQRTATLDDQVRGLREDVAALRDLLQEPPRARAAARQVVATPEHERIARELRDDLIRRENELNEARKELLKAQRDRDNAETQRRKMLRSRTWRWGKKVATVGMAPINAAKALYGWLLTVLPGPAQQALRDAVARSRGGRAVSAPSALARSVRQQGGAPASADALVPIPIHGPEGVGAELTSPSLLLVAYGLDEAMLEVTVDELIDMRRRIDGGIRVLVVTDCDAFHVFRKNSMIFEYIPPRTEWERRGFSQPYDAFRAARFQELFDVYAPDRVVHISSADDLRGLPTSLFSAV